MYKFNIKKLTFLVLCNKFVKKDVLLMYMFRSKCIIEQSIFSIVIKTIFVLNKLMII